MKVLLLNPPGSQLYIRDYYCSKVSKVGYVYQPVDLLIVSGILADRYDIHVVDAIANGLYRDDCLERIVSLKPDAVVFLSGAVSWHEDSVFIKRVKERRDIPFIGTGDLFLEDGERILGDYPFLDAVLLDFTNRDVLHYLNGDWERLENIIYRQDGKIVKRVSPRQGWKGFEIPLPRHELFTGQYAYPFIKKLPFATVLTDYGCPYPCSFCVMAGLGYKYRDVANVMEELQYLQSLGYQEVYFQDQTFGANRKRAMEICNAMVRDNLGLGWVAWSRVDVIDEELLAMMKRAGCHTILFGVETAKDATLKAMKKGYTIEDVKRAFTLCRRHDIRTLATYVIGLPGETKEDILDTIEFAINLDSDYASFNILIPRAGTDLREQALKEGWIMEGVTPLDQSGTYPVMGNDNLSAEEVWELKNYAVRRFYGRPYYIARMLSKVKTFYELKTLFSGGRGIILG